MPPTNAVAELGRDSPLGARKRPQEDTEMDITPMIDCTFLLLIFFTVTSTPDAQTALNLATAKYGVGVSQRDSIIISVAENGDAQPALVYLADGKVGEPLKGAPADQDAEVRKAVEEGLAEGKTAILIKAESGVLHRDVSRVAAAAGGVSDAIKLNLAVMEAK
ncbi:MAG TPA: biopolymer transporter ExbD [Pirellulales bacterium]|nr:biopolymer transporter ExbD [Pirellulales bacterium]